MVGCLAAVLPTRLRSKARSDADRADYVKAKSSPSLAKEATASPVDRHNAPAFCSSCCPSEPLPQYSDEPMTDYGIFFDGGKGAGANEGAAALVADLASDIESHIKELDGELRKLSIEMWDNPEVAWTEHKTHDLFVKYLKGKEGWKVTPHAHGLDTAYRAEYEHRGKDFSSKNAKIPVIGFNSEMDALPGIGHACGHNLIAIAGVAASLSVAHALRKNNVSGRVILLGTPAEEAYGGKIDLLKAGAYKDMDACLMVHPAPLDSVGKMIAVMHIRAFYKGRTAHAGAAPWEGINAQDAGVLAYTNISALRQQIKPDCRVHGIIQGTNWAANVIPDECHLVYNTRAPTVKENEALTERVKKCFQAAADATGCSLKIEIGSTYYDVANNKALAEAYRGYIKRQYSRDIEYITFPASTDFGNVTYALPAMHAEFAIPLPNPTSDGNHTVGFAAAAKTPEAHKLALQAATGIAAVGARIVADADFRNGVIEQWKRWKRDQTN